MRNRTLHTLDLKTFNKIYLFDEIFKLQQSNSSSVSQESYISDLLELQKAIKGYELELQNEDIREVKRKNLMIFLDLAKKNCRKRNDEET